MTRPIFYSGTKNASSWAMRAWLALREAEFDFEEIVIDIRRPQRFNNLARIGEFSPPAAVPVLDTGHTVIFDSNAIMEFANDLCGGRLLPDDMQLRARARSLMAWQHAGLSHICRRISFESSFYPQKRQLTGQEQAECLPLFACFEECLTTSGGPYLFGEVSLADFVHTPGVFRLTRHGANLSDWPKTKAWTRTIKAHPLVVEWMDEADQLPHIWFDDYLTPGEALRLTG
ncbi:MAG: glutathione S-transferase family protein [Rhizobiaceae bacterium]